VTEGEDKPLKYPDMFAASDLMILTKCDLLPHLIFDADLCEANARRINPSIEILRVSATTGEGLDEWIGWIRGGAAEARGRRARSAGGTACGGVSPGPGTAP
jgi:hydrogenase nickel incorporation protein HypB